MVADRRRLIGAAGADVRFESARARSVVGVSAEDPANEVVVLLIEQPASAADADDGERLLAISNRTPQAGGTVRIIRAHESFNTTVLAPTEIQAVIARIEVAPHIGQMIHLQPELTPALAGCPVLDDRGELIGMACTRMVDGQVVSFVLPARAVSQIKSGQATPIQTWSHAAAATGGQVPSTENSHELEGQLAEIALALKTNVRAAGPARVRLVSHLKLHPADGQAVFLFGLSYHREKKYAQAIPYFEQATRLSPHYANTLYFHGWALYYLGQLDGARAAFQKFLQHKPDEPDSVYALGLIDLDQDLLDSARERFEKSVALFRAEVGRNFADIAKAQARLGEVFERQGDLEKARASLQSAVDMYPDGYEAWYKLYRVLTRLGLDDDAAQAHEQFIAARERVRPGSGGQSGGFPE